MRELQELSPGNMTSLAKDPALVEPPSGPLRVLLVDPSAQDRQVVRGILHHAGTVPYEVAEAASAAEALGQVSASSPDAVVFDYPLPDQDGMTFLQALGEQLPDAALLVLTGKGDEKTAVRTLKGGASDYLIKEQAFANPMHLDWAVYTAVYLKRLERENSRLVDALRNRNHELEQLNKRLWELSLTDELTGFYNRRYIGSRLEEEIARCTRYQIPLSVVLMDLDHFKDVNDRLGHLEGDRILRETARLVQQSLRDTDLVGRFGGEEFLLMLTNTDVRGAEAFCNRLREQLEAHDFTQPNRPLHVTGSFGIAGFGPDCATSAALLQLADRNLYAAKARGRNCVVAES